MDRNIVIKELLDKHAVAIVGRLCKQIEILQTKSDLTETQKLSLLKDFNKELIYEEFRDLKNYLRFALDGKKYEKYSIYKPTTPPKA